MPALLPLGLACWIALAPVQETPPTPSGVLMQALDALQQRSLYASRVDWAALRTQLTADLAKDNTMARAHQLIQQAVAALKDPHTRFEPPKPAKPAPAQTPAPAPPPAAAPAQPAAAQPPATQPAATPTVPTEPAAKMTSQKIGYVMLPPATSQDPADLRAYGSTLYLLVSHLANFNAQGWIVDLRLNGGGNMWPMLVGLQPILGNGTYGTTTAGGGQTWAFGCEGAQAWLEHDGTRTQQFMTDARPVRERPAGQKIAVLIGPWTMSSGEFVAASFAGMDGVRFFGKPTGGLTTATEPVALADGSTLNLATSQLVNRAGKVVEGPIQPDQDVSWGDWPKDDDAAVQAATAWLLAPATPATGAPNGNQGSTR